MNRGWLYIIAGGVAETVWATSMKMSNGFTDLIWLIPMLVFLAISLYLLNMGFRAGLPTGPCYAVWTAIGAVGAVIVGMVWLGDALNMVGWICLFMIIAGVVGLNLVPDEKRE